MQEICIGYLLTHINNFIFIVISTGLKYPHHLFSHLMHSFVDLSAANCNGVFTLNAQFSHNVIAYHVYVITGWKHNWIHVHVSWNISSLEKNPSNVLLWKPVSWNIPQTVDSFLSEMEYALRRAHRYHFIGAGPTKF